MTCLRNLPSVVKLAQGCFRAWFRYEDYGKGRIMRICLVICLVTLLSIAPSAQAQDSLLPPCSDAALATLAEIQPAYETLIADLPSMSNRESFVPYIEAYFSWREQLWSQLPLCGEMLEIGVLMDRIASNLVAMPALNSALASASYPMEWNPYNAEDFGDGSLPSQLASQLEAVAARLNDDTRVSTADSALPACSDDDFDMFYAEVFDSYFSLIKTVQQRTTIRNLLTFNETLLVWRREVWSGLPACEGMAEITWHMTNSAGDMAVLLAFYLADKKPEFDLYSAENSRNSALIAEMTPAFLGSDTADVNLPDSNLPSCTETQLKESVTVILEYAELTQEAGAVSSVADAFAFGERQYAWREARLSELPRCAEAFELGLLIDQSTSDVVAVLALILSGVDPSDIPHMRAMEQGSAQLSALVTPIIRGERAEAAPSVVRALPVCSETDLDVILDEIEPEYSSAMYVGASAEAIEELLLYSELQISFRESVWRRLPACTEAYDIAWLMYRITGDLALILALEFAGAANEDIPYAATILDDMDRLNSMLRDVGGHGRTLLNRSRLKPTARQGTESGMIYRKPSSSISTTPCSACAAAKRRRCNGPWMPLGCSRACPLTLPNVTQP